MTVYLAFNEHLDSPLGANALLITDTVKVRSHVRAGFYIGDLSNQQTFTISAGAALTEGWVSVYWGGRSSSSVFTSRDIFSLILNNGSALCAIRYNATDGSLGGVVNFANASANTQIWGTGGNKKIDINFKVHATTGFIYVYVDGVLMMSYTGNTVISASTSVTQLRFGNSANGGSLGTNTTSFSEVIVSDQPTIGSKVITRPFTAFGDVNQFAGAIANINAAASSDATFMSELTPTEILTLSSASIPTLAGGDVISAVFLNFRSNYEPSSPVTKFAPLVRKSGINYVSTAISLSNTVTPYQQRWDTDPATGSLWTEAGVNAIQLGFRADA